MSLKNRLEIVEKYVFSGINRFKLRDSKTGVLISVAARSEEEALNKAVEILERISQ